MIFFFPILQGYSLFSFSGGRHNSWQVVAITMPKNVMLVLGPSCFSGARELQGLCILAGVSEALCTLL